MSGSQITIVKDSPHSPEFSLKWWGDCLTNSIIRCKNNHAGGTTLHAKFEVPIND